MIGIPSWETMWRPAREIKCSHRVLFNSPALRFCTTRSTIAVLARGQLRRRGTPNSLSTKTAFLCYPVDWCFVFSMIFCLVYSQFPSSFDFQFIWNQCQKWPAQDLNLESPAPEADALFIWPTGDLTSAFLDQLPRHTAGLPLRHSARAGRRHALVQNPSSKEVLALTAGSAEPCRNMRN